MRSQGALDVAQGLPNYLTTFNCTFRRYKQRGEAAEAADNVFHGVTYGGGAARDLSGSDPRERRALEAQVLLFFSFSFQIAVWL